MKSITLISTLLCVWFITMSVNSGSKSHIDNNIVGTKTESINSSVFKDKTVKVDKLIKKADKIEAKSRTGSSGKPKSWIGAILFAFFLGGLGVHRFYLGYTTIGIIQLLTLGGLGIWALIDFIRIIVKELKPKNGEYKEDIDKMKKSQDAAPSNG